MGSRIDRQSGLSLIELLIALALGLLLVAGIIQLFVGTKATYSTQQALSRIQEAGRFGIEFLKTDIRLAGFQSTCANGMPSPTIHLDTASPDYDPDVYLRTGVFGWEYGGTSPGDTFALPAALTTPPAANWSNASSGALTALLGSGAVAIGSDVLLVAWAEPVAGISGDPLVANGSGSLLINLNTANGVGPNGVMYATNCDTADLFHNRSAATASTVSRAVGGGSPPGNTASPDWSAAYGQDLQLFRLRSRAYYVGLVDGDGDGIGDPDKPALFRMDFGANGTAMSEAIALVDGVESLQLLYVVGTATATNPSAVTQVVTADAVTDWADVLAVRVALLIRSTDQDVVVDTLDYSMLDSTALGGVPAVAPVVIDPSDDRSQRKVFQFDVGVRNAIRVF